MQHYNFQKRFKDVYNRALDAYRSGVRDADALLDEADTAFLASIGANAQHMFDYVEDALNGGEPDFETALMIEAVRRDYFLTIQKGVPSGNVLDASTLPGKEEAINGIVWLPRIMPKARAKLRGELPPSLMYCCGGDRNFFKTHDIHPAEFLRAVWAYEQDDEKLVAWVEARSRATKAQSASAAGSAPAG
ncbi:MAG: DUF5069 domain-containing protein [Verrucomicrobia bacterium]|nr:MAG: DUF5069 domain-containing protein [Verrucomicrobiota bacterium]